jgi:hypothetical protein
MGQASIREEVAADRVMGSLNKNRQQGTGSTMPDKYQRAFLRDGGERLLEGGCVLLPVRRWRLSAINERWHKHIEAECLQLFCYQRPG